MLQQIIDYFYVAGEQFVNRNCGFGGGVDSCVNINQDGLVGTLCRCTTDNCNKDHQCECPSGPGLKCQVCNGEFGMCNGTTDNGISMECPITSTFEAACWYVHDGKRLKKYLGYMNAYFEYFLSYQWRRGYLSCLWI